jgi:hypothetical protein
MGELLIDAAGALRAVPDSLAAGRPRAGFSAGVLRGRTADERVALGLGRLACGESLLGSSWLSGSPEFGDDFSPSR